MDLTNRIYVDLAEKDRAVQIVSYAATARGEAVDTSASVAEAKQLAQADDLPALVKLAFNQAAGIFAGPDKGPSRGSGMAPASSGTPPGSRHQSALRSVWRAGRQMSRAWPTC